MSADWACASSFTRALTLARSTPTARPAASRHRGPTPSSRDSAAIVITSAVAISVLDGTQSVSTAEPAQPVPVDDHDLGTELGRDQCCLVAARPAPDDRYARHGRHSCPPTHTLPGHGALCRVRQQHGPAPDAGACAPLPQRGTGWLMGWRLTFGGEDKGWEGALATVVEDETRSRRSSCALRPQRARRAPPRRVGGRRHRALPQVRLRVADPRRRRCSPGSTSSTPTRAGCRRRATSASWPRPPRRPGAPDDYVAELRARPCRSSAARSSGRAPGPGCRPGRRAPATAAPRRPPPGRSRPCRCTPPGRSAASPDATRSAAPGA